MKHNIKNKSFTVIEAISYYIIGFQKYSKEIKKIDKNHWILILKYILESVRDRVDIKEVIRVNRTLLNKVLFTWELSPEDFVSYATCIFYVLTNRENVITPEKIVTEFLTEIYTHHPRKTLKEANFILDQAFPEDK